MGADQPEEGAARRHPLPTILIANGCPSDATQIEPATKRRGSGPRARRAAHSVNLYDHDSSLYRPPNASWVAHTCLTRARRDDVSRRHARRLQGAALLPRLCPLGRHDHTARSRGRHGAGAYPQAYRSCRRSCKAGRPGAAARGAGSPPEPHPALRQPSFRFSTPLSRTRYTSSLSSACGLGRIRAHKRGQTWRRLIGWQTPHPVHPRRRRPESLTGRQAWAHAPACCCAPAARAA